MKGEVVAKYIFAIYFIIIASYLAGGRFFGIDPDYFNYVAIFNYGGYLSKGVYEPFFEFIRFLNYTFGSADSVWVLFFVFAFLSVCIKTVAIYRFSSGFYLSFITYICVFFLLHDYTQIRASVAIAVLFFSIHYLIVGCQLKYYFSIVIALCFHFSALIYIPMYYMCRRLSVNVFFVVSVCCFGFALVTTLSGFNPTSAISIILNQTNLSLGPVYQFNVMNLLNMSYALIALVSYLVHRHLHWDLAGEVYLKLLLTGVSIFYFFGGLGLSVLAYRISYLFYPVLIFIIPYIFQSFRGEKILYIPYVLFCLVNLHFLINNVILAGS